MARGEHALPLTFAPLKEAAGCAHGEHSEPGLLHVQALSLQLHRPFRCSSSSQVRACSASVMHALHACVHAQAGCRANGPRSSAGRAIRDVGDAAAPTRSFPHRGRATLQT